MKMGRGWYAFRFSRSTIVTRHLMKMQEKCFASKPVRHPSKEIRCFGSTMSPVEKAAPLRRAIRISALSVLSTHLVAGARDPTSRSRISRRKAIWNDCTASGQRT